MGAALACGRAQGEARASPRASTSPEPCSKNKESATGAAVCKDGSASPQTSIAAAGAQQRQSCAPSEAARTELAGSLSSRSSASQGSDCRRSTGVLRSISSRDLEAGVQEWVKPHVWLDRGPPTAPCEPDRLSTLYEIAPSGKLENLHHPKFGPLLDLACKIFGTESAAVSLMGDSEMYVLEGRGKCSAGDCIENPGEAGAFCCWSVIPSCASVLLVEDALKDARFQASSFVCCEAGIRFYIGAPLVASNGHRLGMMCVYDTKPRRVDAHTAQIVCNLAELAVRELERDWAVQVERNNVQSALRCIDCYEQGFIFMDLANPTGWEILYVSPQAALQTGLPGEGLSCLKFWDVFECNANDEAAQVEWLRAVQQDENFTMMGLRLRQLPGHAVPDTTWDPEARPAAKEMLSSSDCALIGIPANLPALISQQRLYIAEFKPRPPSQTPAAASAPAAKKGSEVVSKKDCGRPQNIPFAGCEVGQLISQDGHVRFYRGVYHSNPVILKVIDTGHELDVKRNDDLVLTSRVTTRLRHPCIVRTMAHCVTEAPSSAPWDSAHSAPSKSAAKRDACWMMLEYCDKGTLQEAILKGAFLEGRKPGAAPDIKAVVSAALEIAMGMAYLHGRDLIHGDLNGDSVWLQSGCTPQGFHCKVGCFALSRSAILARLDAASYAPIAHFPPELLKDQIITKAADAYAFGILMWELYNCARAWANLTHVQVAKAVFINRKLQWPASTPVKFRKLAAACMAYDPEDRPMFSECVEQLHDMWAMYDRCGD